MQYPGGDPPPELARSLAQYRRRAARYDRELAAFEPVREEAVRQLELRPGQTVLDVGCGTGLSFALLHAGIAPRGRIVGIEPSPEMLALARERVAQQGWQHVELLQASAADAPLQGRADAAFFHFTHDVLRDEQALDHVLGHLKPGARVVATGLQWAPPWFWPANAFVMAAALYSVSRLEGLGRPWDKLGRRLAEMEVQPQWLGAVYIARGRCRA